jgi:hypothetical protein
MKNDKSSEPSEMGKNARRSRWRKDEDDRLHYAGRCPFNNAVCWLRNMIIARRHVEKEDF